MRRLFGDLGGIDHLRERRRLGTLVTDDASFEDLMLHSATMGREAITAFLFRALPHLPYGGTGVTVRHTVGGEQGGGYEWTAPARPCRREP